MDAEAHQAQDQQNENIADDPRLPQRVEQGNQTILSQNPRHSHQHHPPVGQPLLGHPGEKQVGNHQLQRSQQRRGGEAPLSKQFNHSYRLLK